LLAVAKRPKMGRSIAEGGMQTSRKCNRRSFMTRVAGGMLATGGAAILVTGPADAQNYSGVTDCDSGNGADRPGYGTGNRNQYTDRDTGPNADPRCHGRGPNQAEGSTSGYGRYGYDNRASGCSDADGGPGADPGGRGIRCSGRTPVEQNPPSHTRHCSDSDSGPHADLIGHGVRC
jgi:hypothetical protein